MRPIRLLLLSVVVLAAMLGLLAVGLYGLARLSWSEQKVAGWLSGELGLPVTFDSLSLGYFPEPWLALEGLTVAAGGGEAAGAIVEAERLRLVLPWHTVVYREYAVRRLELAGLRVHLLRDASSATNWDALSARITELLAGESIAWSLGALTLEDGSVGYRDETAGVVIEASGLGLDGEAIEPGRFFPLKARAALQAEGYIVHAAFDGQAMVDPDRNAYAAQGLAFNGWVGGGTLPLAGVKLAATAEDVNADLAAGTAAVHGLQFDGLGVHAAGQVEATSLSDAPEVTFQLASAPFAPRTIGFTLGKPLPDTRDPAALGQASVETQGTWSRAGLRLDPLQGVLDDSRFTGTLWWPADGTPPQIRLDVDRINLDRYLAPAPPAAGPPASPHAAVEALLAGLQDVTIDAEITVGLAEASGVTAHRLKVTLVPDESVPAGAAP